MHTVCYEVLYLRQTNNLCDEVFERNDIIETTAAHFFKNQVVMFEIFFEHEFKSERDLKKLACNDLYSTKNRFKIKSILLFLSRLRHQTL